MLRLFRLTRKTRLWMAPVIVGVFIASLVSLLSITSPAHAQSAKKEPCISSRASIGYISPFSTTKDQCLGQDTSMGVTFFQFAVNIPAGNKSVTVTGKDGNGEAVPFVKQSDTQYVSKPSDDLGFQSSVHPDASVTCNPADGRNKIIITAKGDKGTQTLSINLCENKTNYVIAKTANELTTSSTPASSTGCIQGTLGIFRDDPTPNWSEDQRKSLAQKSAVTSIKVDGPTSYNVTKDANKADWFTLEDGVLNIKGLEPGKYTVTITYNDKIRITEEIGQGNDVWTSDSITFNSDKDLRVSASSTCADFTGKKDEPLWISATTGAKTDPGALNTEAEEDQNTCNINGIGWIVCPVMTFLAWVSDEAYGLIENFLRVPAAIVADTSGTHIAWKVLRNISNVAFVIVFLIIIYSQMTGMLMGSYGVKKMLPKLIIAAILVNLSFIVCQLAVDVSQLLGAGLTGFFNSMIDSLPLPSNGIGTTWEGVVGGGLLIAGLAGGATVAALAISFPVILAVLLSVLITVLILMGRQAAIVILVVLSPLAFVAYILPNTEQWFKKWLKMFWGILMVYPIVALLYGGGKLASRIIQNVAAESDMTLLSITALGVAALPLIMTPTILKGAMNATGTLGAKLSGMSGKANARVGNKMKTRSIAGRGISSALENRARNRARKQDAFLAKHGTKGVGRVATSVFGGKGYADSLEARAAAQIAAQEKEAVEAADRVQDGITMEDRKAIATAATGSDIKLSDGRTIRATEAAQTAARDNVMSIGSFKDRNAMIEHVINSGDSMTSAAKQRVIQAAYAKGDGDIYGKGFGDKILNKSIKTADDLKRSTLENAASGALQAEHLVQSAPSTQYISDAIYNAAASSDPATQKLANEADTFFVQAAKQARSSDSTNTKTVGKIDSIFKDHGA